MRIEATAETPVEVLARVQLEVLGEAPEEVRLEFQLEVPLKPPDVEGVIPMNVDVNGMSCLSN